MSSTGRSAPLKRSAASPPAYVIAADDARRDRIPRMRRVIRQFALTPLLVVLAFAALAAVSIIADQTQSVGVLNVVRDEVGHVVGKSASSAALQAIATGLVTVTSITFSVLLLAVQQTASSLSPVVFDQFMQRRTNQAFLGFFVGLALFSYVVMAAVQDKTPPILGAALASVLTVVALLILLMLVYSTINQMRPTSVLTALHDRALTARASQSELRRRTQRESTSKQPIRATYVSGVTGYLNGVDLKALARPLSGVNDVEICLQVAVGDHVAYGDTLATVRAGADCDAEALGRELGAALQFSRQRDLGSDPTTGIDQLANIGWSNGSSSKHNPEVAREVLAALRDLAARWIISEPLGEEEPSPCGEPVRVVYPDNGLDRLLDALYSLLTVGYESKQYMTAAAALDAYRYLLPHAHGSLRERLLVEAETAADLLDEIPAAPALRAAREAFAAQAASTARGSASTTGDR